MRRAAARCMLHAIGEDTYPQRISAYAYRKGGSVDMAIMPIRLVVEKCREWGEPFHILQLDIRDMFGSVDYMYMWEAASKRLGKRRALPLTQLLLGTSLNVQWAGQTGSAEIGMGKGGRQRTTEIPPFVGGLFG